MKLVDDTAEAARVVHLQHRAQEDVIYKLYRSRLAIELPVFKESDLEFHNLYQNLEKDTRGNLLKEVDRHSAVSLSQTGGGKSGAGGGGVGPGGGGLAMQRFIQDKQLANAQSNLTFTSFEQVMLALSKVEEGMNELLSIFNSQADENVFTPSVDATGLAMVFELIGVEGVSPKDIDACIRRAVEFAEEDNAGRTMNGGGQFSTGRSKLRIRSTNSNYSRNSDDINSIELSGVSAMMSGVTAKEKITFERFLADPICVDNIAPEHDMAPSNEKIKRAFQIIRASFCLLDTSGDGEITLEELQQSHNMMGELAIGKELKKAFNELPSLVMGDMVVVFANWVLFLDTEQVSFAPFSNKTVHN